MVKTIVYKEFLMNSTPLELGYHMPAEWEPHEATWLAWPKDPLTWPDRVLQVQEVFAKMIEALTPFERVHLLVDDEKAEQDVRKKLSTKKIHLENLSIHRIPTVDSWIRDYGPNFIKRSPSPRPSPVKGEGEPKKALSPLVGEGCLSANVLVAEGQGDLAYNCWIFNAWGEKYETLTEDNGLPKRISHLLNLPMFEPGIVLEGGSIDVNGKGTVLTTEQCLLNKNRNPHLKKGEIEEALKNYLGTAHVLWLGEGIVGDDTDGHIDDIARFVSESTVVTALEEDPSDPNYEPLQENLKRLRTMKDQDGKPLKIATLPMPPPLLDEEGERLPASYANFYIANGVVLVPIYRHKNDENALRILKDLFPDRKVIGLECNDLVFGLGALHCVTQQQPL